MEKPIISVITVVYNAATTLEATLESVLSQNKQLFEYWVIDGGSTDGSVEIIQRYERKLAGWVSEPDKGIFDAMNKGIDRAKGEWLYFLGADDILKGGIFDKVSLYLQSRLAVVYGNVQYDNGYLYRSHIGIRCILENRLHHQGAFYHRRLFDDFRYNQRFKICADYELTLRIFLQKQPSMYINDTIAVFATGGNSNTLTSDDNNNIRGIYLQNSPLNKLLSFANDSFYSYVRAKRLVKRKLRAVFSGI